MASYIEINNLDKFLLKSVKTVLFQKYNTNNGNEITLNVTTQNDNLSNLIMQDVKTYTFNYKCNSVISINSNNSNNSNYVIDEDMTIQFTFVENQFVIRDLVNNNTSADRLKTLIILELLKNKIDPTGLVIGTNDFTCNGTKYSYVNNGFYITAKGLTQTPTPTTTLAVTPANKNKSESFPVWATALIVVGGILFLIFGIPFVIWLFIAKDRIMKNTVSYEANDMSDVYKSNLAIVTKQSFLKWYVGMFNSIIFGKQSKNGPYSCISSNDKEHINGILNFDIYCGSDVANDANDDNIEQWYGDE